MAREVKISTGEVSWATEKDGKRSKSSLGGAKKRQGAVSLRQKVCELSRQRERATLRSGE